jgi:trimeric autotransporter adhesin
MVNRKGTGYLGEDTEVQWMCSTLTLGLLLMVATLLMMFFMAAKPAHAISTFTVNSTLDGSDVDINDDQCDADSNTVVVQCTLRAAIQQANATPNSGGADLIKFSISGDGPHTIQPDSELPPISEPVTIDGYTQGDATASTTDDATENTASKGTNANLKIVLNGTNAEPIPCVGVNGLVVHGGGTTIRGLVINGFRHACDVQGGNGIVLERIQGITNNDNVIEGNFIGTDVNGSAKVSNEVYGVLVAGPRAAENTIGGTAIEDRNLISGNLAHGVTISETRRTQVQNNLIGTDKSGKNNLGNGQYGVAVFSAVNNTIGGSAEAAANTIAFNGLDGVSINSEGSTGNDILRNSIFSNTGLGIDLFGPFDDISVVTPNDGGTADDADTGPNGLQNKPTLTSATTTATTITIKGSLDTKPSTDYKVEFFSQPSGNEGKNFVGRKPIDDAVHDPDGDGLYKFSFRFAKRVPVGQKITATATGAEGTSEFSAPREVTAAS